MRGEGKRVGRGRPCCAKWHSASSMWRLIGAASLLAFFTIQGSAPSSINNDLPTLFPENKRVKHGKLFRNGQIKTYR